MPATSSAQSSVDGSGNISFGPIDGMTQKELIAVAAIGVVVVGLVLVIIVAKK